MEFSKRITLLRKANRVSQRQVAAELGISQALLSHYEKGVREPNFAFLARVCEYYGVTCDYVLGKNEQECANVCNSQDPDMEGVLKTMDYITGFVLNIKDKSLRRCFLAYINGFMQKTAKIIYSSGLTAAPAPYLMNKLSHTALDAYLNICLLEIKQALEQLQVEKPAEPDLWENRQAELSKLINGQLKEADKIISLLV